MVASRKGPKGAVRRSFGLLCFCAVMMPAPVGYQDLAALIARQPAVTERGRQHVRNSVFGTVHAATFSFPRPVGTAIPEAPGYELASLDPRALDVTGAIGNRDHVFPPVPPPLDFPKVDRRLKGDLLAPRTPPQPQTPPSQAKPRKQDVAEELQVAPPAPDRPAPIVEPAAPSTIPTLPPPRRKARKEDTAQTVEPAPQPPVAELRRWGPGAPLDPERPAIAEVPGWEAPSFVEAEPQSVPVAEAAPAESVPQVAERAPLDQAPVAQFAEPEDHPAAAAVAPKIEERFAALPADKPQPQSAPEAAAPDKPLDAGAQASAEPLTDERPDDPDTAFAPAEPDSAAMRMAKLYFGADSPAPGELR